MEVIATREKRALLYAQLMTQSAIRMEEDLK
jgi:hypothetical protein